MSTESWKEEFMPVDASEFIEKSDLECLKHAKQKWTGLIQDNLVKHGLYKKGEHIHNNVGDGKINITDETCSLCRKYYNEYTDETACWLCPLEDCSKQYSYWFSTRNPNPMIKLIEETIKLIEETNEHKSDI